MEIVPQFDLNQVFQTWSWRMWQNCKYTCFYSIFQASYCPISYINVCVLTVMQWNHTRGQKDNQTGPDPSQWQQHHHGMLTCNNICSCCSRAIHHVHSNPLTDTCQHTSVDLCSSNGKSPSLVCRSSSLVEKVRKYEKRISVGCRGGFVL